MGGGDRPPRGPRGGGRDRDRGPRGGGGGGDRGGRGRDRDRAPRGDRDPDKLKRGHPLRPTPIIGPRRLFPGHRITELDSGLRIVTGGHALRAVHRPGLLRRHGLAR